MIEINEIRIGNWFDRGGTPEDTVAAINTFPEVLIGFSDGDIHPLENLHSIPLSDEWMMKFKFHKGTCTWGDSYFIIDKNGFSSLFYVEHWTEAEDDSEWKNYWHLKYTLGDFRIKYVHQLQNLFFSLTGEELKLKENV